MGKSIYKRSSEIFYTPAQATLYLNGYLVEDACFIRFDVVDNWVPHFGYNDIEFRDTSVGQTIVTGELGIVFRYHGYLTRIISEAQDHARNIAQTPDQIAALRKGSARSVDDATLQSDSAAVLSFLDSCAESTDADTFKAGAEFLKDRFWGDSGPPHARDLTVEDIYGGPTTQSEDQHQKTKEYRDYMRPSLYKSPKNLSLRIVHGSEQRIGNPAFAEDIRGIQFRGKSYTADIRVPDGGSIITEVYPFLARNLRPVTVVSNRANFKP